ncbi:RNA polymerase sigma factor [Saccharibacillus alkalitolerans]|uniref:RNA polymerase sigma factor n=1 Tax=Saccharibacillus alkalitolerans TaxID=2705290 RepID=A0ABX0EZ55_9BACL|nr:RNA polymerase sigma factor [Saccharibacillus alkalitolerans]NGZ74017.1 RNA polymerase sigma factor [Saccharibacillus alkalitolerans]
MPKRDMLTDVNEAKLIKRIQRKGDRAAADELVSRHYREIYAFVYRQLQHRENSLDLTQDIFVSMLRSIGSFEGKRSSLRTWLYRIATNRVIDHFRSRAHRDTKLTDPIEDFEFAADEDFTLEFEQREEAGRVLELLRTFEWRTQEIVRVKLFAEQTFAEIAQSMSLPDSTVKTHYYAAIRRIKQTFEEERNEEPSQQSDSKQRAVDVR